MKKTLSLLLALALPFDDLAGTALACEKVQLADGEFALRKNFHHLSADRAGRAENTEFVLLHDIRLISVGLVYGIALWAKS